MESAQIDADFEAVRSVVVKRHKATDASQLELHVGDIVFVLEKDETGWWGGHKEGEDLTGWFPGFCVEAKPIEKAAAIDCEKATLEDGTDASKRSALETHASSPSKRSKHMVASPQRHGLSPGAWPPSEAGVMRAARCSEVLLEETSRQCSLLDNEVAKLKQDKAALEEALRQAERQNIVEKENNTKMVSQICEVERRLQAESTQRKSIVLKCEQLEEELRHRDAEVETLRRLSVVSAMTPQIATPNLPLAQAAQSPIQETHDEGARRRLFASACNGSSLPSTTSDSRINSNATTNSSPDPIVSSGIVVEAQARDANSIAIEAHREAARERDCAAARASSRIRGMPTDEAPPVGVVKQLKNAFEARSQTPQRPQSRARATKEHALRAGPWGVSVTAAVGSVTAAVGDTSSSRGREGLGGVDGFPGMPPLPGLGAPGGTFSRVGSRDDLAYTPSTPGTAFELFTPTPALAPGRRSGSDASGKRPTGHVSAFAFWPTEVPRRSKSGDSRRSKSGDARRSKSGDSRTASQTSRQTIQGLAISVEPAALAEEEIVYGMSPITSAKRT
jgi:hypothetical protein